MSFQTYFSLALLLPLLLLCYTYWSFYSTLLLLVLPILLPFVLSKIKQVPKLKLGLNFLPANEESTQEEEEEIEFEDNPSMENDSPTLDESIANEKSEHMSSDCLALDESIANEKLEHLSSDCSVSNDEEDYSSDDESLIEILLEKNVPNGVISQQEVKGGLILPEFLPELLFRMHRLMDFLSEINEEDNMIEIDIAMGSIKCSRFEIKT